MSNEFQFPENIEESIGYTAWSALSWALHNGWVQDYKWLFSEREGRDIGVPETVERMTGWDGRGVFYNDDPLLSRGTYFVFMDRCYKDGKDIKDFRNLMIEGYLLGTDFVSSLWVKVDGQKEEQTGIIPDQHGRNQLEGEMRRYWAHKQGIQNPSEIQVTKEIIEDYCISNGLQEASTRLVQQLGL